MFRVFGWIIGLAPIWLPLLLLPFPKRAARYVFFGLVVLQQFACLFGVIHADDRDPLQWGAAYGCLGVTWLLLAGGLAWGLAELRSRFADPKLQPRSISPDVEATIRERFNVPGQEGPTHRSQGDAVQRRDEVRE